MQPLGINIMAEEENNEILIDDDSISLEDTNDDAVNSSVNSIIDLIIEQSNHISIDEGADKFITAIASFIKGIIILILLIFIFDTTPIDENNKELIYNKIQNKSSLFEYLNDIKKILLKD